MSKTATYFVILGIILVLAQVIVFNHICLFNVAVPFVFIYLLVRLPLTMPTYQVLTVGFFLGLIIDMFSDTPGMNSMACTVLAMMRKWILHLYFNREDDLTNSEPSIKSLGMDVYIKFVSTFSLFYCTLIFVIESFTFFNVGMLLLRILCSSILTAGLLLGIDSITLKKREKRL